MTFLAFLGIPSAAIAVDDDSVTFDSAVSRLDFSLSTSFAVLAFRTGLFFDHVIPGILETLM